MTKTENIDNPNSCWNKAAGDEPVFVLRANDPIAPAVVRLWATLSFTACHHPDKVASAGVAACAMEAWAAAKELPNLIVQL